jgi:hypothetical protein
LLYFTNGTGRNREEVRRKPVQRLAAVFGILKHQEIHALPIHSYFSGE